MKRLDAGSSGGITSGGGADVVTSFSDRWSVIIDKLSRGRGLRPVDRVALEDARKYLDSCQHLVVCAPTTAARACWAMRFSWMLFCRAGGRSCWSLCEHLPRGTNR